MIRLLVTGILASMGLLSQAQTYPATYHLVDELRDKEVSWLQQDAAGFLWLAGKSGLFRYDGWRLQSAPTPYSSGISYLQTEKEVVWLGFDNSAIARYSEQRWEQVVDSFCAAPISGLHLGDQQVIIATYGEGLWTFSDGQLVQLIPALSIYEMASTDQGDLWLATDQGVFQLYPSGQVKRLWTEQQGLPDHIVQHLSPAEEGVWVATYDRGLAFLHTSRDTVTQVLLAEAWPYGQIEDLIQQPDGTLWISTGDQGLLEWSPGQSTVYPVSTQPHVQQSSARLLLDREGATWGLIEGIGLLHIRADVGLFQAAAFRPEGEVLALHAGKGETLWVSTMEGLFAYRLTTRQWVPLTLEGLHSSDLIISIREGTPGSLWLGTFGQGLLYADLEKNKVWRITEADGLINNNVLDIAPDEDFLWLATLGGVSRAKVPASWPEGQFIFTNYDQQNGLGANYIYDVLVDQEGSTWFATDGEGLTRLTSGVFTNFDVDDGLLSEVIYTLTEDPLGHIWFSTLHEGIYRYDGNSFLHISREEGLHGVDIVALACDPYGHLVIVHEEGVDVLDTRTLDIIHLEDDIGLMEVNTNLNVITSRPNGEVWFGLQEGMVRYKPGDEQQAFQPTTRLEYLEVYLEPYALTGDTLFSYRQNHLSFGFVGIWFAHPQQVSYQYQLEGYDLGWITTKDREAIYPGLTPGAYTFKVRSSIDGHFDTSPVVKYGFRIQRPFWQTGWFIALLFVVALSAFYLFLKIRDRRLQKLERMERERINFQFQTLRSQVNPHFLFNSFNTLLNVIELDKNRALTYVEKLSDFFRSILAYRDAEVISLEEELRVVKDYYFLQQQRYGDNFSLQIDLDHPEHYAVPPLLLQLLVENALKHNIVSRNKPLRVEIYLSHRHLVVRNNLQRKTESEAGTRIGLTNIKKRYQMLTDQPIYIEEEGSYFTVRLPIIPYQL